MAAAKNEGGAYAFTEDGIVHYEEISEAWKAVIDSKTGGKLLLNSD